MQNKGLFVNEMSSIDSIELSNDNNVSKDTTTTLEEESGFDVLTDKCKKVGIPVFSSAMAITSLFCPTKSCRNLHLRVTCAVVD